MECVVAAIGTLLSCACNKMNTSLEEKYKDMKSSKEEFQTLKDKRTELIARVEDVNAKLLIAERVETWLNKADTVKSEVDVVQTKAEVPKRCLCGVLPNCCSRAKLGKQMVQLIGQMTNLLNDEFTEEELALRSPKEEVQLLGDRKQELFAKVSDVNAKLLIAQREGKTRTKTVENWLNKSHCAMPKVDVVLNSCPNGVLPNGCSRAKLGKQMLELNEEMASLLNTGKFTEEELAISVPETVREIPTTRLIGKTAEKNSETVWEWLMGDQFQNIGVHGMGGAGKTSLMKNINERLRLQQPRSFESVMWVTVSKDVNARKLQDQIAEVVNNLDQKTLEIFARQDEVGRSSILLNALRRKGKFVLILDDIWEPFDFDLQQLGVPKPTKDNGCKIVLTTRSREVCERMCQKDVNVGRLLEDEPWELFVKNVEKFPSEVEEIAKALVVDCCGLPLAIITVGQAMKRKTVKEWQLAFRDLQESLNMAMEKKVIRRLKFSYDQLSKNHQKCFLYCALYPEDSEINPSELIEYWVLEGLVKERSKEEEFLRGDAILDSLKGCCMLEDGSPKGYVKMHDLIRDMALYVTESNPKFMVRAGYLSKEVPHEDDWSEDLERVSFMESKIENIPIIPKCPKLLTLIFAQKYSSSGGLKHVEPGFFMHMKSLTVLDLSRTSIESLPDSLSDLVNLRGLLLIKCRELVRVPSLSKLQSLRVLKLTDSDIEELPHGMEMLVNLRSLDLSKNYKMKEMIPLGLISKFSLLQELKLLGIELEYVYARERGGDFVQELSSLTHLENLTIRFHELSDFIYYGEFTNFEKLKKYSIVMENILYLEGHEERNLYLSNRKGIPCNALRLPKSIQYLKVEHFNEISELPFLQRVENMGIAHGAFPCLKRLEIFDCDNIKVLFSSRLLQQLLNLEEISVGDCEQLEELVVADGDESGAIPVLPRLHNLILYGLPELKSNWSQLFMYSNSWQSVTIETVKLDRLFSTRLLQHFQYLEKIKLWHCEELEELIVEEEEEACETVALPRLKELQFYVLPKLKSIWKGVMVCDSLETVEVDNCPELKRLPLFNREHQSAPPSLEEIHGSRKWWDSLEWGDYPRPEHLFQSW